ncbi:glycosyltransferase family A protein [Microbacterium sp.]|uniref:glycosyltransferase family A protein n=1 Tax=Microbacterium sp. TaxID=51671 RepID=UPI002D785C25|nr:glycosyltransferase family A protein [Microbacterium sp.]HET6301197.1 glycosyltransferase family A protein [Microbacterium sp.]
MTHPAAPRTGTLRVSVVIPVKDDDRALSRCLDALARQTRRADEIIVVDNGSSDASALVARGAGAHVVRCERPGIPAASATGYDAASGDVILRLDADCVPASTWVDTMTDAFDRRPDVDAFTGHARFVDGPRVLRTVLAAMYLGFFGLVMVPTLGHAPLFGSNLGMRASTWRAVRDAVHQDDPELHDDIDLAFHVGDVGRIRYLPRAGMGISMRPFGDARSFARRIAMGFRTVIVHWPRDFPPKRWARTGFSSDRSRT